MRRPVILAIALTLAVSCSALGTATQETTEATGVTAMALLLTPFLAILSWPMWHWIGDKISVWLTGTEEIRVAVLSEPAKAVGGGDLPRTELPLWGGSPLDSFSGGNMFWIIVGAVVIGYFGGWAWLKRQITTKVAEAKAAADARMKKKEEEDNDWLAAFNEGQAKDAKEFAAVKARLDLLEKMFTQPPKR